MAVWVGTIDQAIVIIILTIGASLFHDAGACVVRSAIGVCAVGGAVAVVVDTVVADLLDWRTAIRRVFLVAATTGR